MNNKVLSIRSTIMKTIRTNCLFVKLLVLIFFVVISCISTQAQERQIPFDSAGKILVITPQQTTLLPLFSEYNEFKEILLFKLDDTSFMLEVTSVKDGTLQRRRVTKTRIEIDSLQARINQIINERSPELGLDQSGRAELLTYTFITSLGYYGPMLVLATEPQSVSSGSLIYLMGGAGGFFIPYFITSKSNVTKGASMLGISGSVIGISSGYFIYGAIGGWNNLSTSGSFNPQTNQYEEGDDSKYRTMIGLSVATGVLGTIAGVAIANKYNISDGDAGVISSSWAGGLGLAFGAEYISGLLEKDDSKRGTASLLLGASALSIYAGTQLAQTQHFTRSDASIMVTPAYIAAFIPISLAAVIQPDNFDGKLLVGATMASYILGEYVGWNVVKNKDFSDNSGIFTALGTAGGGLIGIGLGLAIDREYRSVPLIGVVGATTGYALMVSAFSDDAAQEAKSHSALQWDISPIGLAMIASGKNTGTMSVPIGSVQWKF